MTQGEIMRMAREAGLQPYYDEQVTSIARFAAIVSATEREKCTNTQEFVTLPRGVAARTCANCLHNKPPFGNCDGCSQQNDDADDEGNWEPIPEPQGEQGTAAMAKVVGMDEYGPMLLWNRAWTDFPVGTKLYTRQQNLHCKSNQARLAALWGYVKADQQPQGDQEPVAWRLFDDDPIPGTKPKWVYYDKDDFVNGVDPTEHFQLECLYTNPQPKRDPLTDEQIDAIADAMPGGLDGFLRGWGWRQFARAVIEATNNIK